MIYNYIYVLYEIRAQTSWRNFLQLSEVGQGGSAGCGSTSCARPACRQSLYPATCLVPPAFRGRSEPRSTGVPGPCSTAMHTAPCAGPPPTADFSGRLCLCFFSSGRQEGGSAMHLVLFFQNICLGCAPRGRQGVHCASGLNRTSALETGARKHRKRGPVPPCRKPIPSGPRALKPH